MADNTARFALPFILPGQAQKELYHNEALQLIDTLAHTCVEDDPLAVVPPEPEEGQCWIVGPGASGAWTGHEDELACWSTAGWRFIPPQIGMSAWNRATGYWIHFVEAGWSSGELPVSRLEVAGCQVVGERQQAIVSPSGGATIDAEARGAVSQIIAALMSHGLIG